MTLEGKAILVTGGSPGYGHGIAKTLKSKGASSCRLSRTIMQLGQAAGTAAALALETSCALRALPPALLRDALRRQHVSLTWPPPENIVEHLMMEH
ncbi:MAG: FAD-dependent oxidoreductase [Kiritimatiellia bacterium]|jgi:NAD(P)-dependent dehydrogenase (short-subunit alcohol dehydrogenase family)